MTAGYQSAFQTAFEDLRGRDPGEVCRRTLASRTAAGYALPFLERTAEVDMARGVVRAGGRDLALGAAMLVLHHLAWARDVEPEGNWVSLKEVPEGGSLFFPAFKKEVLDALVEAFQNDLSAFRTAAARLGAEPLPLGQAGARFQLFPKVPLAVALWGADEELPGSATLLFDRTIHHFAPLETLIGFGYYLAHILVRAPEVKLATRRVDPFWE